MQILGIDPGPIQSAWVIWDDGRQIITDMGIAENRMIVPRLKEQAFQKVAIEMVASYGMPVGKEVFETCVWIGYFLKSLGIEDMASTFIYRKDVKMNLCHSMRAKDGNIRQALIDRFGHQGTKKEPGILYGVSKDIWSALAVAVTYCDGMNGQN